MKHLFSVITAVLASTLLLSCGGEPRDWDADTLSTVFVWKETAYAEHPGVENRTDPGIPSSLTRILVGKRMTMTYRLGNINYTMSATFASPMGCQVETNIIGNALNTYTNASYLYEPLSATTARLTLKFRNTFDSYTCIVDLTFNSALAAEAAIHSFKSMADEEIVAPNTVTANSAWQVVE